MLVAVNSKFQSKKVVQESGPGHSEPDSEEQSRQTRGQIHRLTFTLELGYSLFTGARHFHSPHLFSGATLPRLRPAHATQTHWPLIDPQVCIHPSSILDPFFQEIKWSHPNEFLFSKQCCKLSKLSSRSLSSQRASSIGQESVEEKMKAG